MRIARSITAAGAGLLILTLAACGGGVEGSAQAAANSIQAAVSANQPTAAGSRASSNEPNKSAAAPTSRSDASTSATSTGAATPALTRAIGKTGWYGGFAITVDDVTAEQGVVGGVDVTINLTYQNLGTEEGHPSDADIVAGGLAQEGLFDTPGVPAGGAAKGTATVTVHAEKIGEAMTLDQAVDMISLVYGGPTDNQTTIPLVAAGAVDSVEPKVLTAAGALAQGQIMIEVVSGTLVPSYEPGEKGDTLLNLRIKLTCAADCQPQGYNTGVEEFSITGPDGNSVVADSRSEYCCDALYPGTVSDSERNILTFIVPSPGTGAYRLTYANSNLTSTGTAPATFDFTA